MTKNNVTDTRPMVLVAEDERMLRELCEKYFTLLGFDTLFACNGQEAVNIYLERWQEIDVVMLDIIMPHMNGRDAFKALKDINPAVKAIVASGYSEDNTASELLDDGVKMVLSKPYRFETLKRAIEKVVAM